MKKSQVILFLFLAIGISLMTAQTYPGTANLKHQWTFDNGTAIDAVQQVR